MVCRMEMKTLVENRKTNVPVSQMELSRMLGLSYVTVNRALNRKGGVSEKTTKRVREAARRMGYQKNLIAQSLVRRKTTILGAVLWGVHSSFWGQIAWGIQCGARELGYHLLLANSEYTVGSENEALESLLEIRAAGVLLFPAPRRDNFDMIHQLHRQHIPIVTLNSREESVSRNFIGTDSEAGEMEAMKYLLSLGHRRIAHIAGPQDDSTAQDRLRGYELAMRMNGLKIDPRWIVLPKQLGFNRDHIPDALDALMQLPSEHRPTAISTATDGCAIITVRHLLSCGIRVPQDVSVVGYGNLLEDSYCPVPLTTVDQHPYEMGQRAAKLLIDLIEEKRQSPAVELLQDNLLTRESCSPPSTP